MLAARFCPKYTRFTLRTMTTAVTRPREESPLGDSPSAKRLKVDISDQTAEEMRLPIERPKTYEHELDYRDKLVLAPMVRTGSCEFGKRSCADDQCLWYVILCTGPDL
jgi:hypothetical protein